MSDEVSNEVSNGVPEEPKNKAGRPPMLSPEQAAKIREIALANPTLSMSDLTEAVASAVGVSLNAKTVRSYLSKAGIVRVRAGKRLGGGEEAARAAHEAKGKARYGYRSEHRDAGDEGRYPHGLTEAEWALVRDVFENAGPGAPPTYSRRRMLDACLYVVRTGMPWRSLPKDMPPWQDVYATFRRWTAKKLFETMHDRLRAMWRAREHRASSPTAAVIDSQSVKTSPQGGPKGYDAGKKVKGRKRHLIVDTLGLVLAVCIQTANVQDRDGAGPVIARAFAKYPTIALVYADSGYEGPRVRDAAKKLGIMVEVVRRPSNRTTGQWVDPQLHLAFQPEQPFTVLRKRWIVERTHAWNERPRRLSKDYDRRLDVSESWVWLTESRILARRLTNAWKPTGPTANT